MTFSRGQKVTMIRDSMYGPALPGEIMPRFGAVYTIRDIVQMPLGCPCGATIGLTFEEIRNPPALYKGEPGNVECVFCPTGFRPVVERKLPESLTALLDIKNHTPLPDAPSTIPKEAFV